MRRCNNMECMGRMTNITRKVRRDDMRRIRYCRFKGELRGLRVFIGKMYRRVGVA